MLRTSWLRQVVVLVGCSLCIGLVFGIASIDARTPPDHGIAKPDDFLIHLPFGPDTSSHLHNYSYGACDPANEKFHCGLDYYAIDFDLNGGTVYPIASGTVVWSRWVDGGYGKTVCIEHGPEFPGYVSLYAHLASISVQEGYTVTISTPIGVEGQSGRQTYKHLHFAMRYCDNVQVGQFPKANCEDAVVPETILGQEVYEGLGWWHDLNPYTPVVAERRPLGDSSPPTGHWGDRATGADGKITFGSPIVFDVNYSDDDEVGEIRLTMYYEDWAERNDLLDFDPHKVWRIIARCDPKRGGCGSDHWQLEWNPCFNNNNKGPVRDDGLLPVPWLPKAATPPCDDDKPVYACISFDIFDRAGNPLYAPAGTRCSFGQAASAGMGVMEGQDNQARFITILPKTFSQPDSATFVSDVTIPDGTVLSPGQSFTKIWLMRNSGTSTWDSGYQLVFTGGSQMDAPNAVSVPTTAPGSTANISVSMTAPSNPGTYQSNWQMRNDQGVFFGEPIWVVIVVPSPAPPTDDVELISCSFSPTTLTSGGTLKVDFKVTNHGDNTVSTQGPDPGYVYQEGQSSDTIGHPDIPGRWRVAVEYGDRPETIKDHPYRWGLGSDLAPGEIRTVSGYITLNTIKRTDYWCALIHEQIGGGEDYVDITTITVKEEDREGPKITSHHFEPSSPSNTGVVQVCAEAQDNPGGVGVDHIGVCINGCQYNESIWGAGGCVPWESGHPTYTPGVHDVQIMAVDRNGNWGPSVWTCYTIGDSDITPPRVKNISFNPPSGSPESGTTDNVHITVDWEDPCGERGIESTTVFATDCTFGRPPLGSRRESPAHFDWYVGCLPKGQYTVDVYMQDDQGNARSEFFRYQRGVNDETPPTGSILVNPTPRDSWTVEYTADALPHLSTPAWRHSEGGGYESVSNGILRSGTPDPSHFNYYRQEANLSNQTGTTLEARLKVVSGQPLSTGAIGNNISIFDDARKIRLAIFPDGIRLGDCHVCDEYQMNTTDDFHVYRLTLEGDTAKAYVDGVLRLTGTPVANSAWSEIWFGNDWMGGPDEGLWDYVGYYTGGAVPPPWSVEYTGDALPLNSIPRWERLHQGGYESVSNGILRSGTPDNDHFNYYRQITDVSNETGATLEGRLKVVNGQPLSTRAIGNHITIFDDARKIRLAIFPDGIRLGDCEVCDEYSMVTTDDFHVYRLTLQGDTAKAYVDGVLRLSGTAVENLAWTGIWFGNDWMGGPDEGLWDYVRYYTDGAIAPSADVTRNPEVVLALTAKDEGWGLSQMNIGVCNSDEEEYELLGWEPFAAKRSVTLPPGDGLKYVKVQYSDRAENRSDWYHDTIILDTTPPTSTVSALPAMQTASSFAVGWSGTDSPIDVAKFDVQYKDTTSVQRASSSSSAWTNWYSGTTLSSALFTGEYGHTYYFRTRAKDIAGNVEEYPAGDGDAYTEICFLPADAFESDDTSGSATLIATTGVTQTHNFHVAEDEDWFKFTIAADATYIIQTKDLGSSADTYIYLYDTDATTLLNANDDYGGTLASQIEWQAPMDGTYYLMVKHWNPYVGGCGTEYNIAVRLLGDLDGNCVVDIVDIMLVASHWNTSVGDPNYDPTRDLDSDGDIDIRDIMMVAAHWNERCE